MVPLAGAVITAMEAALAAEVITDIPHGILDMSYFSLNLHTW